MACVLVVGADTGIANSMSRQLHARGEEVIAACLGEGADLSEAGIRVVPGIDVTSDAAVQKLVDDLKASNTKLDNLIHVAGILGSDDLGSIDMADVRKQMEINAIGPLRTIQALVPFLHEGSKVGLVTSRVASLGDNTSGGMGYGYRMSKAAANMLGLNLHHDFKKQGIAMIMLHPGMVKTDLTIDYHGIEGLEFITPDESAAGLIKLVDDLTLETSGEFRHANGELLPW